VAVAGSGVGQGALGFIQEMRLGLKNDSTFVRVFIIVGGAR